jgi:methylase of polypeptide subunit release factors
MEHPGAAQMLVPPAPWRFMPGTRALVQLLYRVRRLFGLHRYDEFILERIHGVPVLVIPSVFNPKRLRTGAYFASLLEAGVIGCNAEVLDMGTGSGVCALFAARHARRVLAIDINAAAARCARINALLNHLEGRIEVRHGDLFEPAAGERFDLILFNPPFVIGEPRNDRDRAWRSTDVAQRFAQGLIRHLKPGGAALLLLSTYGDAAAFLRPLLDGGYHICSVAQRGYLGERLTLYRVTAGSAKEET